MNILIISDIHGNLTAFEAVLNQVQKNGRPDLCILLGDIIDYGPHSNEVIQKTNELPEKICNIWGNHEAAVINDRYERFSSDRGRKCARFTKSILNEASVCYIRNSMTNSGRYEFDIGGKKCLAVHGSIQDEFWGTITPDVNAEDYRGYDYVFSGHSHIPHFFEKFIKDDDSVLRGRKKIIFVNPGSVGQPRNHNSKAQFALLDTETEELMLLKVSYDIEKEQSCFNGTVDDFYRERLEKGI